MKRINRQKVPFIKGLGNIEQTENWIDSEMNELPGICFIGRSNVGKSSLINALFGNKIAKVSQTPGKTREINLRESVKAFFTKPLIGHRPQTPTDFDPKWEISGRE